VAAETVNAKYVFLDIVEYSKGRTIEAQSHIVDVLNEVIREALEASLIPSEQVILLPTGDGVGIVLVEAGKPYDVDVRLALEILERLDARNAAQQDRQRRFQVRIGVNENIDNLVTDINGRRNVTGLGINHAQRIMGMGDGGNVMVGPVVAERLSQRDQYVGRLRELKMQVKHGIELRVCQLVDSSIPYLNSYEPSTLREDSLERLPKLLACYMALLVKHNLFVRSHLAPRQAVAMVAMFAVMALDVVEPLPQKKGRGKTTRVPEGLGDDPARALEYYEQIDVWVLESFLRSFVAANIEPDWAHLFEGKEKCLLVSEEGRRVVARDWPSVVQAMGIADRV
jgi:class 3 adenylate cyclase